MYFSEEEWDGEYRHDGHCEHALPDFLMDLMGQVFGVFE